MTIKKSAESYFYVMLFIIRLVHCTLFVAIKYVRMKPFGGITNCDTPAHNINKTKKQK